MMRIQRSCFSSFRVVIIRRRKDTIIIKCHCDLSEVCTRSSHLKDTADYRSSLRIDHRRSVFIIAFIISVCCEGCFVLACLSVSFNNSTQFFRRVGSVPLIKNIYYRKHLHTRTVIISRINVVRQCNKSDVVHRKDIIYILTDSDIVSSKTAHVLADDKIDLSVFGIFKQTLDARSLETCSRISIVNILVVKSPALLIDIIGQDFSLVFYRKGFTRTLIVL